MATRFKPVLGGIGLTVLVVGFVLFIVAPLVGVIGASFANVPFWQFPPQELTLRWYQAFLENADMVQSTMVSLILALIVSLLSAVVGLMLALGIAKSGRGVNSPLLLVALIPLLIPHLALGLAIYVMLIEFGIPINLLTMSFAQLMVTLPVVVGILLSGVAGLDPSVGRAAENLGASPLKSFMLVSLPLLWPALVIGMVMAAILSFEDSSIALFVNSQRSGLVPLPVTMLFLSEFNTGPILAVGGSVLVVLALIAIVVLELTVGIGRVLGVGSASGGRPLDGTLPVRRMSRPKTRRWAGVSGRDRG